MMGMKANRMLLLGESIDAKEADRLNLSSGMFPNESFRAEVHARAVKLANFPLHSVMASKQVSKRTSGTVVAGSSPTRSDSVTLHAHSARCLLRGCSRDPLLSIAPSSWCVANLRPH